MRAPQLSYCIEIYVGWNSQSNIWNSQSISTDTCKINYTYYSFRWSCDIDIHLFLYGLHDTTLYYYWHHACSCTLYHMYFKNCFFPEITVFVVVKINSFQCQCQCQYIMCTILQYPQYVAF